MPLLAVSDLHIHGPDDPLYGSLLALLRDRATPGDVVVLAGDIFDLFVGDKQVFVRRYSAFLAGLEEAASRGVRIHYIEGNHDFHVRGAFERFPGISVHGDGLSVELGGKRFYFDHGDRADRRDYGYRVLRGFFRSPVMKALVRAVPGTWLDRFGRASSRRSRGSKPALLEDLPRERLDRLRRVYRSYAAEKLAEGYDYVVMGHCHDLDEMSFTIGGRAGQYVNVGYPRAHGSFLSWAPGDPLIQRERLPGQ
jgi:UDP-2,3-diacylglucosamine hydrolase